MWLLSQIDENLFTAQNYTTDLKNGKMVRVLKSEKTGNLNEVAEYLLSFENIMVTDIEEAILALDDTGDDTAYFGILGSFMYTGNELYLQKGVA